MTENRDITAIKQRTRFVPLRPNSRTFADTSALAEQAAKRRPRDQNGSSVEGDGET